MSDDDTKDELTEEDLTLAGKSTTGPDDEEEGSDEEGSDEIESGEEGNQTYVTREGLKALKDELEELEGVKRKEVAQRLKEAISFGDLSENSEYEDAKNEQALLEGRIAKLQSMIKTAKIITEKKTGGKTVRIGSTITIENLTDKDGPAVFTIVGSTETDPAQSKISNESPIGIAVIDRQQGDEVEVNAPAGTFRYKILKVS